MRKILVLLMTLSILTLMFSLSNVIALSQGLSVTIKEDLNVVITPTNVEFGEVTAGSIDNLAKNGNIIIDPTGSNVKTIYVYVSVDEIEPFKTGLKFDGRLADGLNYDLICIENPWEHIPKIIKPTLDVPLGAYAGTISGVVTYTITGSSPPVHT